MSGIKSKILDFLNLGDCNQDDPACIERYSKITLLYFLILIGICIQTSFSFISYHRGIYTITVLDILTIIILLYLFWHLRKTSNYRYSALIYALVLGGFFQYLIATGGIDNNGHIWSFLLPVGVIFFFGHKTGLKYSLLFLLITALNLFTVSVYNEYGAGFKVRHIAMYVSLMVIVYFYERTKEQFYRKIILQNDELKGAKTKAEKADKLKSEFLAQMSHEIRTPVNTILNYTSLLEYEFKDKVPEELADSFNSISSASSRLIRTIDLILDLSAIESGTYEPVFEKILLSTDIIQPIIDEFRHYAETKGIELRFCNSLEKELPIKLDRYTILQSLSNLVHNALKYTYSGFVEVSLLMNNNSSQLIVKDSGVGIAAEYLPRLFEKFSQETQGYTRSFEGNGLGLALVKEYCRINNTEIRVESEKGKGTSFIIDFGNH